LQVLVNDNSFDQFASKALIHKYENSMSPTQFRQIKREYYKIFDSAKLSKINISKFEYIVKQHFRNNFTQKTVSNLFHKVKINNEQYISTTDGDICLEILDSYGDSYKRIILDTLQKTENVTLNMIDGSNLPQATAYRKIRELITSGLLVPNGKMSKGDGRKTITYETLLESLHISINGGDVQVYFIVKDKFLLNSFIYELSNKKIKLYE